MLNICELLVTFTRYFSLKVFPEPHETNTNTKSAFPRILHVCYKLMFSFSVSWSLTQTFSGEPAFTDSDTPMHSRGRAGGMWIETLALGA